MYELDWSDARVLDFDIETRRIGFHTGGRFNPDGCEPIAIAWKWIGSNDAPEVHSLGPMWSERSYSSMLEAFLDVYEQADIVTGHYIRKFDLPILAGACVELGWYLPEKLASDTKLDLENVAGLSQSQENLSRLLGLEQDKFHMTDVDWRAAARLTAEGLKSARERVVQDVHQHIELRNVLEREGRLRPPVVWKP